MPKANCPACQAPVTFPRRAEHGSTATCPECDEEFVPPQLKPKKVVKAKTAYDPEEDDDTYKVGRAIDDVERVEKSRKVASYAANAARREREGRQRPRRVSWFEGPEIWLLIFAVGAGGGLPFGIWLAKSWQLMGAAKVFWLFVALLAVGAAALGLGGSAWAWLRRNR